ncbi:MAG: L,D-transpeptidase family protein [Paracoccaceae bacterium]
MLISAFRPVISGGITALCAFAMAVAFGSLRAEAQVTPFAQSLAEAAADDADVAAFYRERDYAPLWTTAADSERRAAFLTALENAGGHGLPVSRYEAPVLRQAFLDARSEGDRGRLEVQLSKAFLQYAHDVQTGALDPASIDPGIVRDVHRRSRLGLLRNFATARPAGFLRALPPQSIEYAQLKKARYDLQALIAHGGWGPRVTANSLKPGDEGAPVVQLRNRLIAMGYMPRSATQSYDATMQAAVQRFQADHGLTPDGVAGEGTVAEINVDPSERLKSVIVALERERWMNFDRGQRHVWVNLADFTAKIIDDGKVTFESRSVVGKNAGDTRSPEFSDVMEYMVVNPTWNVPRSIVTKEYLPMLQKNPNAAGHLRITDSRGRVVDRGAVDFTQFSARSFPFAMSQPPSSRNALGLVKFMFPNKHNIYLHDTPQKSLFDREVRAFSHGCIRLADPFGFAYALLARQSSDPRGLFKSYLDTGRETQLPLQQTVPVHLVYFTAVPTARGEMTYRRDVYGRDARIFDALSEAGVVLPALQG